MSYYLNFESIIYYIKDICSCALVTDLSLLLIFTTGGCTEHFVAFDWVRRNEDGRDIYSTFLFRGDHYWLWRNDKKRTRYKDPRKVTQSNSEWRSVPLHLYPSTSTLKAIVHVKPRSGSIDELYFFAGKPLLNVQR